MASAFILRRSPAAVETLPTEILLFNGTENLLGVSGEWLRHSGEGEISIADGYINLVQYGRAYGYREGYFRCENLQDLTAWKTLTLRCAAIAPVSSGNAALCVFDSSGNVVKSKYLSTGNTSCSLSIGNLSGMHYVGFYLASYYDGVDAVSTDFCISKLVLK